MMTLTDWMSAKWSEATREQQQGGALLTCQYVDQFQTIARHLIDEMNASADGKEATETLQTFVDRCDASAENLHRSLLYLFGQAGAEWPKVQ